MNAIAQLLGQRVAGGNRLSRLDFLGHLGTDGGRREHEVGDAAWDIWICVVIDLGIRSAAVNLWTRRLKGGGK
jgi:hypothetical protein